jgi:hypothetical protein
MKEMRIVNVMTPKLSVPAAKVRSPNKENKRLVSELEAEAQSQKKVE